MNVVAVLASRNRYEVTIQSLDRLSRQGGDFSIGAVLLDDASTDGTAEAVKDSFPWVEVLRGDGKRFWNLGTRDAFIAARTKDPDYYLWLNDDTMLEFDAVARLVAAHRTAVKDIGESIIVGSVGDPMSGELTYGGVWRPKPRLRPSAFIRIQPTDRLEPAETMNGNCVLIPRAIVERIGVNDPVFTHGMGDFDYGLRARQAGFAVMVAPGMFGTCSRNPARNVDGPLRKRLHDAYLGLLGPKGLPPREWADFLRRWGGPLWPVFWASPYVRAAFRAVWPAGDARQAEGQ